MAHKVAGHLIKSPDFQSSFLPFSGLALFFLIFVPSHDQQRSLATAQLNTRQNGEATKKVNSLNSFYRRTELDLFGFFFLFFFFPDFSLTPGYLRAESLRLYKPPNAPVADFTLSLQYEYALVCLFLLSKLSPNINSLWKHPFKRTWTNRDENDTAGDAPKSKAKLNIKWEGMR